MRAHLILKLGGWVGGGRVEWEFLVAQPTKDEKRNFRRKTSDFLVFFKCERNSFCIVDSSKVDSLHAFFL